MSLIWIAFFVGYVCPATIDTVLLMRRRPSVRTATAMVAISIAFAVWMALSAIWERGGNIVGDWVSALLWAVTAGIWLAIRHRRLAFVRALRPWYIEHERIP